MKAQLGSLADWYLEDRITPATYVWSPDSLLDWAEWGNGNNWVEQSTGTRGTVPGATDKAMFTTVNVDAILKQNAIVQDLDMTENYLGEIYLHNYELRVKEGIANIHGTIYLDEAGGKLVFDDTNVTLNGGCFTGQYLNWVQLINGSVLEIEGNNDNYCYVTLMIGDDAQTGPLNIFQISGNVGNFHLGTEGDIEIRPNGKLLLYGSGALGGVKSSILAHNDNINGIFNEGLIHRLGTGEVAVEIPIDQRGQLRIQSGELTIGDATNQGQVYSVQQIYASNALTEIYGGTEINLLHPFDLSSGSIKTKNGGTIIINGNIDNNDGIIHLGADSMGDPTKFVEVQINGTANFNAGEIIFNVTYDPNTGSQYYDSLYATFMQVSPMAALRVVNHATDPSLISNMDLIYSDYEWQDFDFKYVGETGWTNLDTVFTSAVLWDDIQQKYAFRLNPIETNT